MKIGQSGTRIFVFLAVLVVSSLAGRASAATYNLRADTTTMTLPDGTVVTVWGFADDTTAGAGNGVVSVPGPQLTVNDGTLTINLRNNLKVPISLLIPGLPVIPNANPATLAGTRGATANYDNIAPAVPIPQNPNFPPSNPGTISSYATKQRVRSFTTEVQPGSSASYSFGAVRPGTFLYESGTQPAVQIPMGLYGALVVTSTTGQAYPPTANNPNTTFDRDQVVLFSEILAKYDYGTGRFVTMNEDVIKAVGAQTWTAAVPSFSTLDYKPLYYLINGKSYPDTIAATPISAAANAPSVPGIYAPPGKRLLLRLLNAGQETRVPAIQGSYLDNVDPVLAKAHAIYPQIIAEDARLYPYAKQEFAPILPAGKAMDALVDLTAAVSPGYYALYDRRLGVTNAGVYPGGMMTFLASWDPTARDCSPFKGDLNGDGTINVFDVIMALKLVLANGYDARADITAGGNGLLTAGLPCGKGTVTIADALLILQKAVGLNPY